MSRFNKGFSLIPYADVTSDMVTASIYSSKDHMIRQVRGEDDNVIVIYNLDNASTFSAYKTYDYREEYSEYLDLPEFSKGIPKNTVDFVEIKGDIKDATSSEIYDIEITTAGTGYSAGTLTATGGGGSSFKGTYAVNGSGAITALRILNMGTGYTSTPTIVISDSGDSNAVLTPRLRGEALEGNTRVLDISLKDDLTYASTLTIDKNSTATANSTTAGLSIDYDHTGIAASGQILNNTALDIDVNSNSPTMVGTVNNKGIDIMCMGGTSGTQTNLGLNIITRDADTNDGIKIQCDGTHLKLVATADADDYATFSLADTGDLTIATVGDGTTDSDLILDADGSIELNADAMATGDGILFKDSAAKFADFQVHHSATWLYLYENGGASNDDYLSIATYANGATTITTQDNGGTAANLTLDIDGSIALDSSTGSITCLNNGSTYTPSADADIANKAYVDTNRRWSIETGGYRSNNNSSTIYYFQYRPNGEVWSNTDSSPTTLSVYDSYASMLVAPYDGKVTKISVHGYANDTGAADPIKFYVFKGTPSSGGTNLGLQQIGVTGTINPVAARQFVENTDISSGNAFSQHDAIFVMYKKDSTSGNQDLYFSITVSGEYTS